MFKRVGHFAEHTSFTLKRVAWNVLLVYAHKIDRSSATPRIAGRPGGADEEVFCAPECASIQTQPIASQNTQRHTQTKRTQHPEPNARCRQKQPPKPPSGMKVKRGLISRDRAARCFGPRRLLRRVCVSSLVVCDEARAFRDRSPHKRDASGRDGEKERDSNRDRTDSLRDREFYTARVLQT